MQDRTTRARLGQGGRWLDYIKRAFEGVEGPLHESEIVERALKAGLITEGRTPRRTANRVLNQSGLFERVGRGYYRPRVDSGSGDASRLPTEIREVSNIVEGFARGHGGGQSFQLTPERRQAIELHAVNRAKIYFHARGWHVEDVSRSQPFDLRCTRADGAELRVEVKGTTSGGSRILLTPNEVAHARDNYPNVALFVVGNIRLTESADGDPPGATGGEEKLIEPWDIRDGELTPLAFTYTLPS